MTNNALHPASYLDRLQKEGDAFWLEFRDEEPTIHDICVYDRVWCITCQADSGEPLVWRRWDSLPPFQIVADSDIRPGD